MIRRLASVGVVVFFLIGALAEAAPVRLARHPDYRAGKIAVSYLGDIWVANEDGSNPVRLTDNTGRDVYPRFSPDGKWIAFSSNRYGNYDVFVVPMTGGAPRRLTYYTGSDEVVGWSRDSQHIVFRSARGDGAFPSVATLYEVPVGGGPERALPMDWGYWGAYSPDGKQFVFNRHPSVWSRKHYRGSYAADVWVGDLAQKSYRKLLGDERYNRYWPMWGPKDEIYYVADPLPNDKAVKPGSPEVRRSVNNIYKVGVNGGAARAGDQAHERQPVLAVDVERRQGHRLRGGLRHLEAGRRLRQTTEIKLDISADEKENQFDVETVDSELDAFDLSPSGRRAVVSDARARSSRSPPIAATSRAWRPTRWPRAASHRSGRPTASTWRSCRIGPAATRSGSASRTGRNLKQITTLDNEKGALLWTPDSKLLLYTAADKKLYAYSVADGKTAVVTSSDVGRIGSVAVSPDNKWVAFSKQDRTMRSHVYIAPITGGEERHVSDDSLLYAENNAVWTADGKYLVFTSTAGVSGGVASTGSRFPNTMQMWAVSLRDQDKDPLNRDIDNEAQGLAAEAASRQGGGRGAGAGAAQPPVEIKIDWDGFARRARRLNATGDTYGGLTPTPDGHSVAFTSSRRPPQLAGRSASGHVHHQRGN